MCKIFGLAGIKDQKRTKEFLRAVTIQMIKTERDGFGYAAIGPTGLFGEKWLRPEDAWRRKVYAMPEGLEDMLVPEVYRDFFGTRTEEMYAVIMHSRQATCGINMANVHPFYQLDEKTGNGLALIHNGIISNRAKLDLSGSDKCDSAGILNEYVKAAVFEDIDKLDGCTTQLDGSYACGVLGRFNDYCYLDVFRHDSLLTLSRIQGIGLVWCTNTEIIRNAAAQMKPSLVIEGAWSVFQNQAVRIDAVTGQIWKRIDFKDGDKVVTSRYWGKNRHLGDTSSSDWMEKYAQHLGA